MSRFQKRARMLGLLALAALGIYLVLARGTPADTAAVAPSSPVQIEQPHDPTARPLDSDFKAAMERDSQAAASGSGAMH